MKTETTPLEPESFNKSNKKKERLLILDILRIAAIFLIVFEHIFASRIYPEIDIYYLKIEIFNIFQVSYGTIGILLFVFTSGFSLALNYPNLTIKELKNFYKGRLLRIYPAYWTAILFAILVNPTVLNQQFTFLDIVKLVSGLEAFPSFSLDGLMINNNFWFVSLILQLYLLYPLILYAVNKKPAISVIVLLITSTVSCYIVAIVPFLQNNWLVFSFLFLFGLGILLTKNSLYPKWLNRNKIMALAGDTTFYIYLLNAPLLFLAYNMPFFLAALTSFSFVFLLFDSTLRKFLT